MATLWVMSKASSQMEMLSTSETDTEMRALFIPGGTALRPKHGGFKTV